MRVTPISNNQADGGKGPYSMVFPPLSSTSLSHLIFCTSIEIYGHSAHCILCPPFSPTQNTPDDPFQASILFMDKPSTPLSFPSHQPHPLQNFRPWRLKCPLTLNLSHRPRDTSQPNTAHARRRSQLPRPQRRRSKSLHIQLPRRARHAVHSE